MLTRCTEDLNLRPFWFGDFSDWVCVVWLFSKTHRCLFTTGREGIDSQNTTLKINFMGFVTGAERHSAFYTTVNSLGCWQEATPQVNPAQTFSLLWKRGFWWSSEGLIVSQDNPFCDSCSYSQVWHVLESTWEIYSSGSLWGLFQRVLTERRRPFLKGDAQIPGAPRIALWLAVRVYCYHSHPPPVSPQAELLRDRPLGLSSYWVLCNGSQPS